MATITIEVDNEIAQLYQEAEIHKQQKIQTLVNDLLKKIINEKTLDDLIQEMQSQAKNNGLTQEILDEILKNG
jgi:calcineurin-like phosphoesterase